MDPYEVLGVSHDASADEIKKAYRNLARKFHPDMYTNEKQKLLATQRMQELNSAYDMLKNGSFDERESYYCDAVNLMDNAKSASDLKHARDIFQSIADYKDSKAGIDECNIKLRKYEVEEKYRSLTERLNLAFTKSDYEILKQEFGKIAFYKDCRAKADYCGDKILEFSYSELTRKLDYAVSMEEFTALKAEFDRIPDYKDSREKSDYCGIQIDKLRSEERKNNFISNLKINSGKGKNIVSLCKSKAKSLKDFIVFNWKKQSPKSRRIIILASVIAVLVIILGIFLGKTAVSDENSDNSTVSQIQNAEIVTSATNSTAIQNEEVVTSSADYNTTQSAW